MDDGDEPTPDWWFMFGVVDSDILPLNISQVLCGSEALRVIKMHLVKKCLDMSQKSARRLTWCWGPEHHVQVHGDQSEDVMPLTLGYSSRKELTDVRCYGALWWLRPDCSDYIQRTNGHVARGDVDAGWCNSPMDWRREASVPLRGHFPRGDLDVGAGDQDSCPGSWLCLRMPCLRRVLRRHVRLWLTSVRKYGALWWLRPGDKTQATIEYDLRGVGPDESGRGLMEGSSPHLRLFSASVHLDVEAQ